MKRKDFYPTPNLRYIKLQNGEKKLQQLFQELQFSEWTGRHATGRSEWRDIKEVEE